MALEAQSLLAHGKYSVNNSIDTHIQISASPVHLNKCSVDEVFLIHFGASCRCDGCLSFSAIVKVFSYSGVLLHALCS